MTRILLFVFIFTSLNCFSQLNEDSNVYPKNARVNARVYDAKTGEYLSFANIGIKKSSKGTISNEDGVFMLNIEGFNEHDSIIVRYVGYKDVTVCIADLLEKRLVPMHKDMIDVAEFFVYGNELKIDTILAKVLSNRKINYNNNALETEMFIRSRSTIDIKELKVNELKNTFKVLSDNAARQFELSAPRQSLSYTDFLGKVYLNHIFTPENKVDSIVKIKEKKVIGLRDDMDEVENPYVSIFDDTEDGEYWKVASGIFSVRIDATGEDEDEIVVDEKNKKITLKLDSTKEVNYYKNSEESRLFQEQISRSASYTSMNDEDDWAFLYYPENYSYKLDGGLIIDGEEVYVISFTAKSEGVFDGIMYVACGSYALIKAEYQYADEKMGVSVHLFGITYVESVFRASVLFEKHNGKYQLKYLFKREGKIFGADKKFALIKKRERFLLDKTLAEIKYKLTIMSENISSIELLVLSQKEITESKFRSIKQEKVMKVKYVDKFDDTLWEGYSIIAPTTKMKEYQKY